MLFPAPGAETMPEHVRALESELYEAIVAAEAAIIAAAR
jgi:hypothetical protein